jgi:hypothetical protein
MVERRLVLNMCMTVLNKCCGVCCPRLCKYSCLYVILWYHYRSFLFQFYGHSRKNTISNTVSIVNFQLSLYSVLQQNYSNYVSCACAHHVPRMMTYIHLYVLPTLCIAYYPHVTPVNACECHKTLFKLIQCITIAIRMMWRAWISLTKWMYATFLIVQNPLGKCLVLLIH